jgi:hypothetical protein
MDREAFEISTVKATVKSFAQSPAGEISRLSEGPGISLRYRELYGMAQT